MIELKFTGSTLREIREEVMASAGEFLAFGIVRSPNGIAAEPSPQLDLAPVSADSGHKDASRSAAMDAVAEHQTREEASPSKRKPGRPPAAEKAAAKKEESAAPRAEAAEDAAVVEPETVTKDQLVEALNAVFERHDIDRARACLAKFGVSKIQELKSKQYPEFLAECKKQVD